MFASTEAYFDEALRLIYPGGPEDANRLRRDEDGTIAFEPPPDLQYRLRWLPHSYLKEQGILPSGDRPGRLRVTFSKGLGERGGRRPWSPERPSGPTSVTLADVHPLLDWVTDKALAAARHDQAFVLAADGSSGRSTSAGWPGGWCRGVLQRGGQPDGRGVDGRPRPARHTEP